VTIGERWSQVVEAVRPLGALAGPALRWTWRVALVTGVAAAGVWGARAYKARPPAEKVAKVEKAAAAAVPAPKPVRTETASKRTAACRWTPIRRGARLRRRQGARLAPLAIDGLSIGSHAVTIRGEKGTVERMVAITASRTTQVNEAIYPAGCTFRHRSSCRSRTTIAACASTTGTRRCSRPANMCSR
jgi:hypothetical protein